MPAESFIQKVFKVTQAVLDDGEGHLLLIGPHGELVELICDEETGWLDVDWVEVTEH